MKSKSDRADSLRREADEHEAKASAIAERIRRSEKLMTKLQFLSFSYHKRMAFQLRLEAASE